MSAHQSSRKVLAPLSPKQIRKKRQPNASNRVPTVAQAMPSMVFENRLLSSAQLQMAKYLAATCPHGQRKHHGLLEDMKRKRKLRQEQEVQQRKDDQPSGSSSARDTHNHLLRDSMSPALPPQQHPACGPHWRLRAASRLKRAGITLEKEWSSKTWSNKTNVPERLFLLEADGVDVTQLQHGSISSAQVTEAIMDRIEERKKQGSLPIERTVHDITHTLNTTQLQVKPILAQLPADNIKTEDLSEALEYRPTISACRKRKCGLAYSPTEDLSVAANSHAPHRAEGTPPKKIRIRPPRETEEYISAEAWVLFKRNIIRNVFKVLPTPYSSFAKCWSAKITIRFPITRKPGQDLHTTSPADLQINSRAYEHILEELSFLADHNNGHCKSVDLLICDPDFDEEKVLPHRLNGNPSPKTTSDQKLAVIEKSQRRIHIHRIGIECIIEGDVQSLQGLLKRLQEHDLVHTTKWVFDGLKMIPSRDLTWSLSTETQLLLAKVRERLRAGGGDEARNIHIDWVYGGDTYYV